MKILRPASDDKTTETSKHVTHIAQSCCTHV